MNHPDRRKNRASIGLEALEGRKMLSTMDGLMTTTSAALIRGVTYANIQGTAQGTVSRTATINDTGDSAAFRGHGNIQGLGRSKVAGLLHGTGYIAPPGHVGGQVTLGGGKGSLTLQLQGPPVGGFTAPDSGTYSYAVVKGTGAFKHAVGSGTVDLAIAQKSFTMNFHGKPNAA